jgi:hypothetical protein
MVAAIKATGSAMLADQARIEAALSGVTHEPSRCRAAGRCRRAAVAAGPKGDRRAPRQPSRSSLPRARPRAIRWRRRPRCRPRRCPRSAGSSRQLVSRRYVASGRRALSFAGLSGQQPPWTRTACQPSATSLEWSPWAGPAASDTARPSRDQGDSLATRGRGLSPPPSQARLPHGGQLRRRMPVAISRRQRRSGFERSPRPAPRPHPVISFGHGQSPIAPARPLVCVKDRAVPEPIAWPPTSFGHAIDLAASDQRARARRTPLEFPGCADG